MAAKPALSDTTHKERRARRWCLTDLVTDPYSGKLKETLLWSNLGKLSALSWFSYKCYDGADSEWLWLIVMGVLTCHAAFSQLVSMKFGGPAQQPELERQAKK